MGISSRLFDDVRAVMHGTAAAHSSVRVRDLVATGQVTQHVVDSSVTSYQDSPQGSGDLPSFLCTCGETVYDREDLIARHVAKDHDEEPESGFPALDGAYPSWHPMLGDVTYATVSGPVVCDISADEQAEQDAAELAYLRSFGMGTWLSSQPSRFRYATSAYRGSSR
jgi:hypothetical protein